jgi:hypothetical protein
MGITRRPAATLTFGKMTTTVLYRPGYAVLYVVS